MPAVKIAATPKVGGIYWTAYADLEGDSGPTDPLRFDMYAQRLGNLLVPGITNRTARARYLSMVCAGIATTSSPGATVRQARRAFLPFERGWALAMTAWAGGQLKRSDGGGRGLRPEYDGLRGANRVLRHYRTLEGRDSMKPADYVLLQGQDSQGGLGAYLVTLREFGFVHPESLKLTATGQELAAAFRPKGTRGISLGMLVADQKMQRGKLERLGGHTVLGWPSTEERDLIRAGVFLSPRSRTGDVVGRVRAVHPNLAVSAEQAMRVVAESGDDPLAEAAEYALRFDSLRISSQRLFTALGTALGSKTDPATVAELADDRVGEAAQSVGDHAAAVAEVDPPPGLDAIRLLARDCAVARDTEATVEAVVAHHRREQRGWVIPEGRGRYRLGQHGPFDEPADEFNGYTLGRALVLHRDLDAT